MKSLPVRRAQFKTAEFAAWLAANGAEICTPTNPYEVVRYRAYHDGSAKALTHIVYAKETGLLTFTGATQSHYIQFMTGSQMWVGKEKTSRKIEAETAPTIGRSEKVRRKLIERDGNECWFCGLAMGADATIEHLVSKSDGGFNKIANLALAHAACNQRAGNLPLVKKIELRATLRASVDTRPQGGDDLSAPAPPSGAVPSEETADALTTSKSTDIQRRLG